MPTLTKFEWFVTREWYSASRDRWSATSRSPTKWVGLDLHVTLLHRAGVKFVRYSQGRAPHNNYKKNTNSGARTADAHCLVESRMTAHSLDSGPGQAIIFAGNTSDDTVTSYINGNNKLRWLKREDLRLAIEVGRMNRTIPRPSTKWNKAAGRIRGIWTLLACI